MNGFLSAFGAEGHEMLPGLPAGTSSPSSSTPRPFPGSKYGQWLSLLWLLWLYLVLSSLTWPLQLSFLPPESVLVKSKISASKGLMWIMVLLLLTHSWSSHFSEIYHFPAMTVSQGLWARVLIIFRWFFSRSEKEQCYFRMGRVK